MGFFKDLGAMVSILAEAGKSVGDDSEVWAKMLPIMLKLDEMDAAHKLSPKTANAFHAYNIALEEEEQASQYTAYDKMFGDPAMKERLSKEYDKKKEVTQQKWEAFIQVLDDDTTLSADLQKEIDDATEAARNVIEAEKALNAKADALAAKINK